MKDEYTEEDFKRAVPNPYYKPLCTEITVGIPNEAYDVFKGIADKNSEDVKDVLKRSLVSFSKVLQETE